MRPVRVVVSAPGVSQWIPINYLEIAFAIGIGVMPWSTATGQAFTVQHTFDSLESPNNLPNRQISIARAGTTATVTDLGPDNLGHGLATGDSVIIISSGSTQLDSPKVTVGQGDLGWTITVTGNTTYTFTCANAGPTTDGGNAKVTRLHVFPHATIAAATTRVDGNYAFPPTAIRLNVATLTGGSIEMDVIQGMGH
jgi:hypothetical protein